MKEVLRLDHGVLTHFPASAGRNKPALILCPGGGYEYCSIREGAPVARAFARDGVEAFVLEYDCTEVPLGVKPLHTLSVSVAWVREHAAQLGIAADRIAVGGFSAGAHLAGLLAATWHDADWFPRGHGSAGAPTECGGVVLSGGLGGSVCTPRQLCASGR